MAPGSQLPYPSGLPTGDTLAAIPSSILELFAPLGELLRDPEVRRVLVDGQDRVFVDRGEGIERVRMGYSLEALKKSLRGLARRAGKSFDPDRPCLEAMLKDGTRFIALRSPVVGEGPVLGIARPAPVGGGLGALEGKVLSSGASQRLQEAMAQRQNLLVVGPPGSGRVRMLEALTATLSPEARIACLDEVVSLRLAGRNVLRLVPRQGDGDTVRAVSAGDLLYCAGRLAVDRILVPDLKLGDAWDAVSLLSSRAAPVSMVLPGMSAEDGLARLDALACASTTEARARAVGGLIASGVDLVICLDGAGALSTMHRVSRGADGWRLVALNVEELSPSLARPVYASDPAKMIEALREDWKPTRSIQVPVEQRPDESVMDEDQIRTGVLSLDNFLPEGAASQEELTGIFGADDPTPPPKPSSAAPPDGEVDRVLAEEAAMDSIDIAIELPVGTPLPQPPLGVTMALDALDPKAEAEAESAIQKEMAEALDITAGQDIVDDLEILGTVEAPRPTPPPDADFDDDEDDEEDATIVTEVSEAGLSAEMLSKKTFSQVLRSIGSSPEDDESSDDWLDPRGTRELERPGETGAHETVDRERATRSTVVHPDE